MDCLYTTVEIKGKYQNALIAAPILTMRLQHNGTVKALDAASVWMHLVGRKFGISH